MSIEIQQLNKTVTSCWPSNLEAENLSEILAKYEIQKAVEKRGIFFKVPTGSMAANVQIKPQ